MRLRANRNVCRVLAAIIVYPVWLGYKFKI